MTLKTVREIATEIGQPESTIRTWIKKGKFPIYRPGGRILIAPEDFKRFIKDSREQIRHDPDVKALILGMFRKTA
jgi:excisionase family DNA binding protein